MVAIAKLVGIALTILGVVLILKPQTAKKMLAFAEVGKRVFGIAVARIIVGAILILAAGNCMMPWLVVIIGLFIVAIGAILFILGEKKDKENMEMLKHKPNTFFRKFAMVPLVLGLLLLWAI